MTNPTPPKSYPFLEIARKYDVPYGDVLLVADFWDPRNKMNANPHQEAAINRSYKIAGWSEIVGDICEAINEQKLIRDGVIDWRTGAERPVAERPQAGV